jgi:hypothetical protein
VAIRHQGDTDINKVHTFSTARARNSKDYQRRAENPHFYSLVVRRQPCQEQGEKVFQQLGADGGLFSVT